MDNIRVTVYVTNYNYGQYLQRAVDSVLSQTLQEFELLIIDDGSTDDSRKIMEQYASTPRVKLIYQQNRGLNVTNNIALRLAHGQYIIRLDADDFFESDALASMVQVLDSDPDIGLVFPDFYIVDRSDHALESVRRLDFDKEVSLLDQPAHGACTMIRREFLLSLGGYDETYTCQDGYELWIKFTARHKVRNINRPLFHYRQHGENLTGNEHRILQTRMSIKRDFVKRNSLPLPKTVAIIPVRDTRLSGSHLAYSKLDDKTLLQLKIETLLASTSINTVIVASENPEVGEYVRHLFPAESKLRFAARTSHSARFNASLLPTIIEVLNQSEMIHSGFDAVLTAAVEYPFVTKEIINDAVNSLAVFNSDSLISVRPDNSLLFQHHGQGMVPILGQEKFTKLEREALYRAAGGVMLSRIAGMRRYQSILHGAVGHVVVGQSAAFAITSENDHAIARFMWRELRPIFNTDSFG